MSSGPGSNRHHGVPRSFTGSNDHQLNLTSLNAEEHEAFHEMAGHLPPDFFVRKLILASMDWQNDAQLSIPVGFYRDSIEELLTTDWRSSYADGAIRKPQKDGSDQEFFARSAIHVHRHITGEQYQTADALKHLREGSYLSPQSINYREGAARFFGTQNPVKIIRKFLLDSTGKGEYKWTKPMLPSVRSHLLTSTRMAAVPEVRRNKDRTELMELMEEYRTNIAQCFALWQPNVNAYSSVILDRSEDVPFFHNFLMRSA